MKPHVATTLTYLAFGVVWILLSDQVVEAMFRDPASISRIQSMKGLVFVGLSTLLIFQVSRELYRRELQREQEKSQLYAHTMQAVQHVLRNFLNQMQLVTIEAEETEGFDPEALELAQQTIFEAEGSIEELSRLEDLSPEALRAFIAANLDRPRSASVA